MVLLSPSELDPTMKLLLQVPIWAARVIYIQGSALKDSDLSRCRWGADFDLWLFWFHFIGCGVFWLYLTIHQPTAINQSTAISNPSIDSNQAIHQLTTIGQSTAIKQPTNRQQLSNPSIHSYHATHQLTAIKQPSNRQLSCHSAIHSKWHCM